MVQQELVTVFRADDDEAETKAHVVRDMLRQAGLTAEVFDYRSAELDEDVYEVRVPAGQSSDAEEIVGAQADFSPQPLDISHDLDMVPVFVSDAHNAEMLTIGVRSILDAHGIPSVLVAGSPFPNLPFEIRVPKTHLDEARQAIAAAAEAGPAAAEEAERESELSGGAVPGDLDDIS